MGITFDDKWHSERDWNLRLLSFHISMPVVKEREMDIPSGDGNIDYTEIYGRPAYGKREDVKLVFDLMDGDYQTWFAKYSEFAAAVHGRKVKMVLDDEQEHYYMARLNLDGEKKNMVFGRIVFEGTAEPFKYDITSSADDWLWDSFNFETGIIQELRDVSISEENSSITICSNGIDVVPVFFVSESENLRLQYGERIYQLYVGRNRFPSLRIGSGETELQFTGIGRLTVDFRGRYL